MARTYQQAIAGLLPDEPVLVVGQPTAVDPSRAPAGKHVLWVQVRMLPAEIAGRCGGRDRAATTGTQVKERYADRVIGMIETLRAGPERRRSSAARCSRRSTSSARTPIWSAATRSAAAIICRRTSCSARRAALRRWNTPVENLHLDRRRDLAGRRSRAQDRATCSPNSLAGGSERIGSSERRRKPAAPGRLRCKQTTNEKGNGQ